MAFYNKSGGNRGPKPFGNKGNSFGGGRPSFGSYRRDDNADRPMFSATCAECGTECQVPFRPNGTKPVFCNNCFKRDEAPRFDTRNSRPQYEQNQFSGAKKQPEPDQYKIELQMINSKLDRILKLVTPVVTIEPVVEKEAPAKKTKSIKRKAA